VIGSRFQAMQDEITRMVFHPAERRLPWFWRLSGMTLLLGVGLAGTALAADCAKCGSQFMPNRADAYAGADHVGSGFCAHAMKKCSDNLGFSEAALRYSMPSRTEGGKPMLEKFIGAGFAMRSEFLWEHHYAVYRDLAQRDGREKKSAESDIAQRIVPRQGHAFCLNDAASCHAAPSLRP